VVLSLKLAGVIPIPWLWTTSVVWLPAAALLGSVTFSWIFVLLGFSTAPESVLKNLESKFGDGR